MSPLMTEDELKRLVEETAEAGKDRAAALRRALDAELSRRQAAEREVERLREALEKGAEWFEEYADHHQGKGALDKASRNLERANYLRRARQSLQGTGEANPNPQQGKTL